jgi:uncharacterized coiled-coil DUF342 family protein
MSDPTSEIHAIIGDTTALDGLKARYAQLCKARDAANKKAAPVQKKLDDANEKCETFRREAAGHVQELQNIRGGDKWLSLKKEIGQLARLLGGR